MSKARARRFSPEVRERAVRLVREQVPHHTSQWAAIAATAPKLGCTPETFARMRFSAKPARFSRQRDAPSGTRPPDPLMYAFIDDQRALYGVEPICRVAEIAPSGDYEYRTRQTDPTRRAQVRTVWETNLGVYGVRKVWQQLLRDGESVARCTAARLMAREGLRGVVRGQWRLTTVADPATTSSSRPWNGSRGSIRSACWNRWGMFRRRSLTRIITPPRTPTHPWVSSAKPVS